MKTVRAAAAVIRKNDRIFAAQRGYGEWKGFWEFPGGKLEPGEDPQDALTREIQEELHTVIAVGEKIAVVEYDYPAFHLVMTCFWATIVSGDPVLLEHEEAKWLTGEQLCTVEWLPADRTLLNRVRAALPGEETGRNLPPMLSQPSAS